MKNFIWSRLIRTRFVLTSRRTRAAGWGLMLGLTLLMAVSARHALAASPTSGLEPMEIPNFDEFYVASEVRLPVARKIHVADVSVEFNDRWLEQFTGVTAAAYREGIAREYGQAMKQELVNALKETGWEIANTAAADTLLVVPRLHNLYIVAPETSGIKQVIVSTVGQAGIELVFQSPEYVPFMKIVDYRQTQTTVGSPVVANRTNNYRYFKMLMADWAKEATAYLDMVVHPPE